MAEDDSGDKTEDPTERKRHDVREKGSVARSHDLTLACSVLAAASAVYSCGPGAFAETQQLMRGSFAAEPWTKLDVPDVVRVSWATGFAFAKIVLPWLSVMFLSAIVANLAQVGFFVTPNAIQPDLNRLNPISGFGRVFSLQSAVKLLGSMLKLAVFMTVTSGFLMSLIPQLLQTPESDFRQLCGLFGTSAVTLSFRLAIALVMLAVADYGFQLWKFEQDLKMTKQEIRDEFRNMEGDPQIRSRRREAHRKLINARQMNDVKRADAVVTNPTHYAVALRYDPATMAAPAVVAKGVDTIAEQIRRIAAEHRVPIIEKPALARALYRDVKVGQSVPVELYEAVAEILGYVYRLSGKRAPISVPGE